jgi:hypothetical protein
MGGGARHALRRGVVKRYGQAANVRAFDSMPDVLTEMDALSHICKILDG